MYQRIEAGIYEAPEYFDRVVLWTLSNVFPIRRVMKRIFELSLSALENTFRSMHTAEDTIPYEFSNTSKEFRPKILIYNRFA